MADYYPLIARAVGALENSTGETRRAIYERARAALVGQLRSVQPALSESDITRERLGLEEAIRRVESDAARREREAAREAIRDVSRKPADREADAARGATNAHADAVVPEDSAPASHPPESKTVESKAAESKAAESKAAESDTAAPKTASPPRRDAERYLHKDSQAGAHPRTEADSAPADGRGPLSDNALRGFRHVIAEAEQLGAGTAEESRAVRGAYASVPAPSPEAERLEPRFESDGRRARDAKTGTETEAAPPASARDDRGARAARGSRDRGGPSSLPPDRDLPESAPIRVSSGRMRRALVWLVLLALCVAAVGTAYLQRERLSAFYDSLRGPATQTAQETPATTTPGQRAKIPDRIGQDLAGGGRAGTPSAVAQRVVLFEQIPNSSEKKQSVGSVIWRTEMSSPGPRQPEVMTIKADVEIPERHLRMTWSMRRNTDPSLPASHTIEIIFNGSADFPANNVSNVPGILMDVPEQNRGVPLAGLAVKVTNGFFLVGLSSVEVDVQRNTQLLKDRPWIDIPIVYTDGGRALLAIEKGTPGERVFADAFTAWSQN